MRAVFKKLLKDAKGNVLMLGGAGAIALVGGAGLGVDTVQWYLWKRQLQQSVDSGALAGGQAKAQGTDFRTYAAKEVNRNANTAITVVRIANAPATGAYTADSAAVEVVATTRQPLPFSSVFLDAAPTLSARAVATTVIDGEHCLISLAPNGIGVNVSGSADVQLGCGVSANSADPSSISVGGSSYLQASPLSAVGGISYSSASLAGGTTIQPYGVEQSDPIASRNLAVPANPAGCTASNLSVNPHNTQTISPGRYCNGINVRGTLIMNPGVYILDEGTFLANSQAEIIGEGVTIILTGANPNKVANLEFRGGSEIDLRAPTKLEDASWYNILIFQDPTANFPESKLNGGSDLSMEGVVYMPRGDVTINGSSAQQAQCLLMVVYRADINGNADLQNNCPTDYDDLDLGARIVRVVE